jgi:hypothetical protein
MSNSEIGNLEVEIDQAKEMISLNDELQKLFNYGPFKRIIDEGFFKDEAIRLVALKMDPEFRAPDKQESVDRAMFAIGGLRAYFHRIYRVSEMAKDALDDMHATHATMLTEDADEA